MKHLNCRFRRRLETPQQDDLLSLLADAAEEQRSTPGVEVLKLCATQRTLVRVPQY